MVGISSVKRTLKRYNISKYSQWKKWHQYPPKPVPTSPGILVQLDTMFEYEKERENRLCAYAMIDVCSRYAYAAASVRTTTHHTLKFISQAEKQLPFIIQTVQTDHGSEFSKHVTRILNTRNISHRHSRVRRPTDNSYVERFIKTLQNDCLHRVPTTYKHWKKSIPEFIQYYNTQRPHMALNFKTPREWLQGID